MLNRYKYIIEILQASRDEIDYLDTLISTIRENMFNNRRLNLPDEQKIFLKNLLDQTTRFYMELDYANKLLKRKLTPFKNKRETSSKQDINELLVIENEALALRERFEKIHSTLVLDLETDFKLYFHEHSTNILKALSDGKSWLEEQEKAKTREAKENKENIVNPQNKNRIDKPKYEKQKRKIEKENRIPEIKKAINNLQKYTLSLSSEIKSLKNKVDDFPEDTLPEDEWDCCMAFFSESYANYFIQCSDIINCMLYTQYLPDKIMHDCKSISEITGKYPENFHDSRFTLFNDKKCIIVFEYLKDHCDFFLAPLRDTEFAIWGQGNSSLFYPLYKLLNEHLMEEPNARYFIHILEEASNNNYAPLQSFTRHYRYRDLINSLYAMIKSRQIDVLVAKWEKDKQFKTQGPAHK